MSDDHGAMDHGSMKHGAADTAGSDHSTMDHSTMDHSTMDHSGMDHSTMDHSEMDHSGMDHASMGHQPGASQDLPATAEPHEPIPALTPADRAAAFKHPNDPVIPCEQTNLYFCLDLTEAGRTSRSA